MTNFSEMTRQEELCENKIRDELENWETVVAQAKERASQKGGGGYQYKYWREKVK